MIVKKLINTKVEGNIEITKREIKEVSKEDEKKILDFVQEIIEDDGDPESYYSKGIADDFNGDLAWINFDWLINESNMIKVLEGNYSQKSGFEAQIDIGKEWLAEREANNA